MGHSFREVHDECAQNKSLISDTVLISMIFYTKRNDVLFPFGILNMLCYFGLFVLITRTEPICFSAS